MAIYLSVTGIKMLNAANVYINISKFGVSIVNTDQGQVNVANEIDRAPAVPGKRIVHRSQTLF